MFLSCLGNWLTADVWFDHVLQPTSIFSINNIPYTQGGKSHITGTASQHWYCWLHSRYSAGTQGLQTGWPICRSWQLTCRLHVPAPWYSPAVTIRLRLSNIDACTAITLPKWQARQRLTKCLLWRLRLQPAGSHGWLLQPIPHGDSHGLSLSTGQFFAGIHLDIVYSQESIKCCNCYNSSQDGKQDVNLGSQK